MRIAGHEFRAGLWSGLLVIVLLVLLIGLGFWQLDRADQKRVLLHAYQQRPTAPVIPLHGDSDPQPDWHYRRASAEGEFDAARQFLLDNRVSHERVGYYVLTPLRLAHTDTYVLVNRGWVPQGATREDLPPLPVPSGQVSVQGLIDFPPAKVFTLGEGEDRAPGWPKVLQRIRLTLQAKQLHVKLLPMVLLLNPDQQGGFVREWTPVLEGFGPERHVGYAVQWFSLAVALVVLYVWSGLRAGREGDEET